MKPDWKGGMRTNWRASNEPLKSTPGKRKDGELYARPKPNPFSEDWCEGYDDGIAGIDGVLGQRDPQDYWDGVHAGQAEREEMNRSGGSNP